MSTCNRLDQSELSTRLQAFFSPEDIEWKPDRFVAREGKEPFAVMLAYVTNRAIMARLDEVVGPGNWRNSFEKWGEKGVVCRLSIRFITADGTDYWVNKTDGADETQIESTKGGLSSAMKRAGSQWGIGRYLYGFPDAFCPAKRIGTHQNGKPRYGLKKWGDTPDFPAQFLPEGTPAPKKSGGSAKPVHSPQDPAPAVDGEIPLVELPEGWEQKKIGFGKHKDKTWGWFAEGSSGGERENYLGYITREDPRLGKEGTPLSEGALLTKKLRQYSAATRCLDMIGAAKTFDAPPLSAEETFEDLASEEAPF